MAAKRRPNPESAPGPHRMIARYLTERDAAKLMVDAVVVMALAFVANRQALLDVQPHELLLPAPGRQRRVGQRLLAMSPPARGAKQVERNRIHPGDQALQLTDGAALLPALGPGGLRQLLGPRLLQSQ